MLMQSIARMIISSIKTSRLVSRKGAQRSPRAEPSQRLAGVVFCSEIRRFGPSGMGRVNQVSKLAFVTALSSCACLPEQMRDQQPADRPIVEDFNDTPSLPKICAQVLAIE